jgi:CRP/FNR family cyclic AMP-dependent transcriptional regulator
MGVNRDMDRTVRKLKSVALFGFVAESALTDLAEKVGNRGFEPDQIIVQAGEGVDTLFIFTRGWAKITTLDAKGQELVISHVGPGQSIGDLALMDGQPYQVSVTALVPVQAAILSRQDFDIWLQAHPQTAPDLLKGMADKMRLNTSYIEKAIEWNNRIAQGDYSLSKEEIDTEHTMITTRARPDEAVVAEFLAAFNAMVEGVKGREETLKRQIQDLSIQVDPNQVNQEVEDLTDNTFFRGLKEARDRLKNQQDDE